ncbi:MAG: class I SAM-dependent methyltransferase [Cyanobacteriota bacterium]|nr:class I SAM-dependent methyltransferase [Cyanobacteriota bacterium]
MKNLKQSLSQCYGRELEQRKHWYSPAAEAYQQARPRYPSALIDRVAEIAQLRSNSTLLEVGCGPAVATPDFAALGCRITGVEPNPDFHRLARATCAPYSNVELHNCSFEEWALESEQFDAVLAASSFHWIPPDIGYPKAAAALHSKGHLILLWNKELQPRYEVYRQLSPVYEAHAPSLNRTYEDRATQVAILDELGQMAIASGQFQDLVSEWFEVEVTYPIEKYLLLLKSYSPYLKLAPPQQQNLFEGLQQILEQNSDTIQLSYISAFHIARPLKISKT